MKWKNILYTRKEKQVDIVDSKKEVKKKRVVKKTSLWADTILQIMADTILQIMSEKGEGEFFAQDLEKEINKRIVDLSKKIYRYEVRE
jgi:hypothetical protein